MFEHIHFHIADMQKDPLSYAAFSPESVILSEQMELMDGSAFFQDGSFCMKGITRSCLPRPLTEFAREHFFYIQSFSIMNSATGYFTKRQNFDSYLLSYTLEGSGHLEYGRKSYSISPGEGFLIDCRNPHYYCTSEKEKRWIHCDLHFLGAYSDYIFQQYLESGSARFIQSLNGGFLPALEKLITLHEAVGPLRELQISNQLESLLVMLLCQSKNYEKVLEDTPEHLKYLVNYMNYNYASSLTLDFLADFSGISKYHLCRLFKKYIGFSPNEYLIQLRVENAKKLLKNTTMPANKIGGIVGIPDENYFYRIFKRKTGLSPLEYRNEK